MPRTSKAAMAIVPVDRIDPQRIPTPQRLSGAERRLFEEIVAAAPAMQFVETDTELLVAYVQACLLARSAYKEAKRDPGQLAAWERCAKMQATLATRLRLTPHARTDPQTLARHHAGRGLRQYGGASREAIDLIANGKSVSRGWLPRA